LKERVILTADSTLMSNYHRNEFLGFGTCAPSNFIPDFLYEQLFFPAIRTMKGVPTEAPYGLRKIEAQLVKEGFDVSTVAPNHLKSYLKEARVLGIHVMDPFGLGPASSTLAAIMKKEPFLARHFRELLSSAVVREAKQRGLKIIVGGPGVWQMRYRTNFVKNYGIDCIIDGEAENVAGKLFKAAINGEDLPPTYETSVQETPSLDEIPEIVGPSVNGLVEIGRGCCRGCSFCSVTQRPLRWFPIEKILEEMDVNRKANVEAVVLHTDDVMLYGSKNTQPDDERLFRLNEAVLKKCNSISWSHCSLAAVASKPKLFEKVAEIIRQKQPWWGVEIGLETGSPELAKKIMPAKAHPFKPEDWPDVVRTGMALMHDNKLVPACTLIVGVPEETENDVIRTIELMDDLKAFRSLIVPLFFVPMGRLKDEDWFRDTHMTRLHYELLTKCVEHDLHWVGNLISMGFSSSWRERVISPFYRLFIRIAKYKMRQAGIDVKL
jgi:radical SAM superfamily enzyme YgiQ (UPF0313 family)